jgi:hypothetical protein
MGRSSYRVVFVLFLLCMMNSCDGGLEPPPANQLATLSGVVHFSKPWPPKDSVNIIALVLVQDPPPFTVASLLAGYGKTVLPITLNYLSSDTAFSYTVAPAIYHYLGVAQNYNGALTAIDTAWKVVGFSHDALDSARSFNLVGGTNISGVDVYVNFDTLPRQPFVH